MTSMPYTPAVQGTGLKASVQRFGGYLAGMVMPNITAFIAWGLITALFIPTGWLPNAKLATLVGPMISVLLPLLIGYTGGRMVYGQRGAVVGAIATMGVVVGSAVPQFLGAMLIGPLAAFCVMQFDKLTQERIKAGFEMLVENFSAGIIGAGIAILGFWVVGPVVTHLTDIAGHGVNWLVTNHVLPFAAFIIEPAKVLFLNNAINTACWTRWAWRRPRSTTSRSCSCWRPTRAPASACCWPTSSSARAPCARPCRPRSSSSSSAASTRSTLRTC